MPARALLAKLASASAPPSGGPILPSDDRLFVLVDPGALHAVCGQLFRELGARYVISIGADDRPFSGGYLVAHDFALDGQHLLGSAMAVVPAEAPRVESISDLVPGASWAEREMRDLLGIESAGQSDPAAWCCPTAGPRGPPAPQGLPLGPRPRGL